MAYSERAPSRSDGLPNERQPSITPEGQALNSVQSSSSKRVRILLTNDDGIEAPGLAALADALANEYEACAAKLWCFLTRDFQRVLGHNSRLASIAWRKSNWQTGIAFPSHLTGACSCPRAEPLGLRPRCDTGQGIRGSLPRGRAQGRPLQPVSAICSRAI